MDKTHGYYVSTNPALGLFGPFAPSEIPLEAIDAGHAKEDEARRTAEIDRRSKAHGEKFLLQTRRQLAQVAAEIVNGSSSGDISEASAKADRLGKDLDRVESVITEARSALDREFPLLLAKVYDPEREEHVDPIVIFRWQLRRRLANQLGITG